MKRGKRKQTKAIDRPTKVAEKQLETLPGWGLKPWHTAGLVVAVIALALGWLIWNCTRSPNISFLPRHSQAEWILFPNAMDSKAHVISELDTIFRREFVLNEQPGAARLEISAAKRAEIKINDTPVGAGGSRNWKDVTNIDVAQFLQSGSNKIEIKVLNDSAPPALWLRLTADKFTLSTDPTWETSCTGSAWRPARLASSSRVPGPGNAMAGGERTWGALSRVWYIWLIFAGLAIAIWIAAARWFGSVLGRSEDNERSGPQTRYFLFAIVGLWVLLFLNNAVLAPFNMGFDAAEHSEYIKYVQEHHALPLPRDGFEMFQPPLFYLISAIALSFCGLSVDGHAGTVVLRLLTFLFGLVQLVLLFHTIRLLLSNRRVLQVIGLFLGALLPMQLYLSHYVTNETLAATLVTASIYLGLRLLGTKNPTVSQFAWLGLCLGGAMLAKATALLVVIPIFLGLAVNLVWQRTPIAVWSRQFGSLLGVFFITCGWHYFRIWSHYGNPFLGNWDPRSGFAFWQDPGYHTAADYFRFGISLSSPLFSSFWSFADGIYSTLWGDGLCGGAPSLTFWPPWNYGLMVAGYFLALVPTTLIAVGAGVALWRFVHKPSVEWLVSFGLTGAVILGIVFMTLKVASYAQVKAFYGLAAIVPICCFGALGWEVLTRRHQILQGLLGILLLVWGVNSFASFWMVRSITYHIYASVRLGEEQKVDAAREESAKAAKSDPSNEAPERLLASSLSAAGRLDEALSHAQQAVRLSPENSLCHQQLGLILLRKGQMESALKEARRAVELGPESSPAYKLLVACLSKIGHVDEAIIAAGDGLAVYPFNADLHHSFGLILAQKKDFVAATRHFIYALLLDPNLAEAQSNLRVAFYVIGKTQDGMQKLREVESFAPNDPVILAELGWFFATQPDSTMRNGAEAVRLAEHAFSLIDWPDPRILVTLAAAYGEAARIPDAIRIAEKARVQAESDRNKEMVALSERLLGAFQNGHAYHEIQPKK